jgi:alpha-glucosidase (family GH31 glycosyl hydrolase)
MSPIIKFNQTDGSSIFRYITLGGKVEAYFMMQGTAKEIIARYQNIIGKPKLPPFWAMGFHAASYAYDSLAKIQTNVE